VLSAHHNACHSKGGRERYQRSCELCLGRTQMWLQFEVWDSQFEHSRLRFEILRGSRFPKAIDSDVWCSCTKMPLSLILER